MKHAETILLRIVRDHCQEEDKHAFVELGQRVVFARHLISLNHDCVSHVAHRSGLQSHCHKVGGRKKEESVHKTINVQEGCDEKVEHDLQILVKFLHFGSLEVRAQHVKQEQVRNHCVD